MLQNVPQLDTLREAIGNRGSSENLAQTVETSIQTIFHNPPPKGISAETRVAAIGLLSHAMARTSQRPQVFNLITRLLGDQHNNFLFEHEKTLLNKVANRGRRDRPQPNTNQRGRERPGQPAHPDDNFDISAPRLGYSVRPR